MALLGFLIFFGRELHSVARRDCDGKLPAAAIHLTARQRTHARDTLLLTKPTADMLTACSVVSAISSYANHYHNHWDAAIFFWRRTTVEHLLDSHKT